MKENAKTVLTAQSLLMLDEQIIHNGDHLAICILNSWIAGCVEQDHTDWYLLTHGKVGIRLSVGLPTRWEHNIVMTVRWVYFCVWIGMEKYYKKGVILRWLLISM